MTSFADLQSAYESFSKRRNEYCADIEEKVIEIAKGFRTHLHPEPSFFVGRDGKKYDVIEVGMVDLGEFKRAALEDFQWEGDRLKLAFRLSFVDEKPATSIETVVLELGVSKHLETYSAVVCTAEKDRKVDISPLTAENDLVRLYEVLADEVTRKMNPLKLG